MLLFYNQRNWFLVTWWISKYPLQHWHKRIVTSRSRCDQIKIERSSSETTIKFTLHIIEPKLCIEYIWNIMVIILHHYYFPKINQLLKSGSSSYLCVKINPVFEWLTISALKIGLNFTLHLHNKEIWNLNWQFFKNFLNSCLPGLVFCRCWFLAHWCDFLTKFGVIESCVIYTKLIPWIKVEWIRTEKAGQRTSR